MTLESIQLDTCCERKARQTKKNMKKGFAREDRNPVDYVAQGRMGETTVWTSLIMTIQHRGLLYKIKGVLRVPYFNLLKTNLQKSEFEAIREKCSAAFFRHITEEVEFSVLYFCLFYTVDLRRTKMTTVATLAYHVLAI